MRVENVIVRERHRKDMGDVDPMRELIQAQAHPSADAVLELPKLQHDEIALRSSWWRLCRHHGEQLPAEPGVIVIQGGK